LALLRELHVGSVSRVRENRQQGNDCRADNEAQERAHDHCLPSTGSRSPRAQSTQPALLRDGIRVSVLIGINGSPRYHNPLGTWVTCCSPYFPEPEHARQPALSGLGNVERPEWSANREDCTWPNSDETPNPRRSPGQAPTQCLGPATTARTRCLPPARSRTG